MVHGCNLITWKTEKKKRSYSFILKICESKVVIESKK